MTSRSRVPSDRHRTLDSGSQILHVRKTPSYFVNGAPLETFGYDPLVALVESELAVQYPE